MDPKKVQKEYRKMRKALEGAGEATLELIDPLLKEAARLRAMMDEDERAIRERGRFQYSNKGNVRESPAVASLARNAALYQRIYKSIDKAVGLSGGRKKSRLQEFLESAGKEGA